MPFALRHNAWFKRRNRRVAPKAPTDAGANGGPSRWWPRLFGLCTAGAGLLALGLLVRASLLLGPLRVHGIEVRGLERTGREGLLAHAELALHQPLLLLDLDRAVAAIEQLPWVRQATIRRQLPDKLRIEVTEHVGKAAAMLGELWLVNPDGEPFKRFSAADRLVLPVITGVAAQPHAERPLGRQPQVTSRLQEGLGLLDALVEVRDDLYNVDELHHDADLGWSAVLLLGRAYARPGALRPTATVHLGPDPQARLPVLPHVLNQLADRHEVPEVIWANHVHQEGRVQVQLPQGSPLLSPAPSASAPARNPAQRRAATRRVALRPR